MASSEGTRQVAATAPTTTLEEGLSKTSGRSSDGGGYGADFARQVEQQGVGWGSDKHINPLQPSGDSSQAEAGWFERSIHTAG
jgi:hypothetical protein